MSRKMVYGDFGSVSSGTMRAEDLIPEFVYTLEQLHRLNHRRDPELTKLKKRMERRGYYKSDDADYDLDSLFDSLNEYAPSYAYFGANEGDGADYGFWLSSDFQQNFRDNGGLEVSDTSQVPRGYTGEVLHVNDHGNATLYNAVRGRLYEIWTVV